MIRAPLLLLHPREQTLHRYTDRTLVLADQARVAAHLAECGRCRARVDFANALGQAARQLGAPAPGDQLLRRVLDDRAAGTRTILPAGRLIVSRRARSRLPWHGAATAAATVAAVVGIVLAARGATHAVYAPLLGPRTSRAAAARLELRDPPGLLTGLSDRAGIPTPSFPPARLEGVRLHPLRATYSIASLTTRRDPAHKDGRTTSVRHEGRSVIDVVPTFHDGVAAWRVVRTLGMDWASRATPRSESVHLARGDLRLLDRTENLWRYRQFPLVTLHQQLTGNDLDAHMSFGQGLGRRVTRELLPEEGPYVTDAISPILLMAVPLRVGWTGSVSMLRWAIEDDDVASPVAMRVVGEERVTVPAGTFDCWRVTVVVDGRPLVHWVRKSDGLMVRVSEPGREVELVPNAP